MELEESKDICPTEDKVKDKNEEAKKLIECKAVKELAAEGLHSGPVTIMISL